MFKSHRRFKNEISFNSGRTFKCKWKFMSERRFKCGKVVRVKEALNIEGLRVKKCLRVKKN